MYAGKSSDIEGLWQLYSLWSFYGNFGIFITLSISARFFCEFSTQNRKIFHIIHETMKKTSFEPSDNYLITEKPSFNASFWQLSNANPTRDIRVRELQTFRDIIIHEDTSMWLADASSDLKDF